MTPPVDPLEFKVMTKKRFSILVEELVLEKQMTYMDAIVHIIEERGMEYENIKNLMSKSLTVKLEAEAGALKLIDTKDTRGNKLPGL
jgi:hypothetical protein